MADFFPFQRLRIKYVAHDDDESHAYEGPGEYVRPVNPDDEDFMLPDSNEPLHYVRVVLGNDSSEHIFPESALSPAPQRDLGGLIDRVQDMLDQIEPMMRYLGEQMKQQQQSRVPFSSPTEVREDHSTKLQTVRERLREIASGSE